MLIKTYVGVIDLNIRTIIQKSLPKHEWLVLEKVHGQGKVTTVDGDAIDAAFDKADNAIEINEQIEYERLERLYGKPSDGNKTYVKEVFSRAGDLLELLSRESLEPLPNKSKQAKAAPKAAEVGTD